MDDVLSDALAHCLATEGKSRPIVVPGLGTFHLRNRGGDAKDPGWGVLFLLDDAFREALGREERLESREGLRFDEWLEEKSGRRMPVAEFAARIRDEVAAGRTIEIPALGTFRPRASGATVRDPSGAVTRAPAGWVVAFTPSEALRKRLSLPASDASPP